jgi:hypothetical protein
MNLEYKKPGAWLWTGHESKSLQRDVDAGVLQRDWRFRIPTETVGQFREYTLDELLWIDAIAEYQKQPLPPPMEFPEPIAPLGLLLARYLNRYVGVNYRDTKKFERALLTRVSDDFFTVFAAENKTSISFPLRHVLSVVEADKGVTTGMIFRDQFCVVIEVFHVVVYSGAVGISIPL